MDLYASKAVINKIEEIHSVTFIEAEEAFFNFKGKMLEEDRRQHRTKPPTYWFLSETFDERLLKIVVKIDRENNIAFLRTAYEPSQEEINFYEDKT